MTQKPRRVFTDEQKAEAVRIVNQSGKPVSQVAKEMGLTETALRNWIIGHGSKNGLLGLHFHDKVSHPLRMAWIPV